MHILMQEILSNVVGHQASQLYPLVPIPATTMPGTSFVSHGHWVNQQSVDLAIGQKPTKFFAKTFAITKNIDVNLVGRPKTADQIEKSAQRSDLDYPVRFGILNGKSGSKSCGKKLREKSTSTHSQELPESDYCARVRRHRHIQIRIHIHIDTKCER